MSHKFDWQFVVSCAALTLPAGSVDAVVTDIPFGVKHGTIDEVRHLLPKLVPSLHRCVSSASDVAPRCDHHSFRNTYVMGTITKCSYILWNYRHFLCVTVN